MRSARLFFPSTMTLLMKRARLLLPKRASGGTSRRTTRARLGIQPPLTAQSGRFNHTVHRTARDEGPAYDMIAHAGQVLDPAATDQHHRVLLEVVALAGDVGGDLHPVGQ